MMSVPIQSMPTAALLVLAAFATATAADLGPRPAKPADLTVYLTGDPNDAIVDTSQGPGLLLMGGGSEVKKAFANHAFPKIPGGDIVILRTSGSDGYNDYFFEEVTTGPERPNSVETMMVTSRASADSDYVAWVLAGAEMIWMAGGDQSTYTSNWRGTKVEAELRKAWERGAIIGGTSAGMAVCGEFIYDPLNVSALNTATAVANPYSSGMLISDRLFDAPWMDGVITDTHFRNRDRMGRMMAMMAYLRQENRATVIRGVALSEASSLFIDKNGLGTVDTNTTGDALYVVVEQPTTERVQVAPGQALVYTNTLRYKLLDGETFNFADWTTSVDPMTLSVDGTNSAAPYTPTDPYAAAPDPDDPPVTGAIYYEDFERQLTLAEMGLTIENGGGSQTWSAFNFGGAQNRVARINFNRSSVKDDWMITPAFALTAGVEYAIEFWYQGGGNSTTDVFDLYIGTAINSTGFLAGSPLQQFPGLTLANTPTQAALLYTAETTSPHRLAFHARSPADQNTILVDEVLVQLAQVPPAGSGSGWIISGE